ncbi:hypothetical protein CCR95_23525, partial [Thiocystis minor]|uniref:hypothetical protein n=1 Tax=Thiocystis minor TaxID=61597 RepID=UPI001A914CE5
DPRFFQLGLAASALRFTTVVVTLSGDLFAGRKSWPMPGTLGANKFAPSAMPRNIRVLGTRRWRPVSEMYPIWWLL